MAETVIPSVRGKQRLFTGTALGAGATGSALIVGFAVGVAGRIVAALWPAAGIGAGTGPVEMVVVSTIVSAGLVLDLFNLVVGLPRPLTLGRQVPREWGRLLPPPLTAVLYGARLGVGPLTILSTWTWWAALLAAATVGVWTTVVVSVWFALTRTVVNAAVSRWEAAETGRISTTLRRRQQHGRSTITAAGVALVLVTLMLAACGSGRDEAELGIIDSVDHDAAMAEGQPEPESDVPSQQSHSQSMSADGPAPTIPAVLEDFVRISTVADELSAATDTPVNPFESDNRPVGGDIASTSQQAGPVDLAAVLPKAFAAMTVIPDESADRFLTIEQAAAIQPDPTEEIALLETRGFKGGWVRAFRSATDDVAVASVYQFKDAAEAEFYLEDGLITIGGYGGDFFDVPELPGVRGFHQDFVDDGQATRTLGGAFTHGARWHLLYVIGSPQTVTPELLLPALADFQARVVGS